MASLKVLMVCLGNICRSPTAEGIFRQRVRAAGLDGRISVDSAGTSDWHVGEAPDPRTVRAAAARNYDLSALRGRQVSDNDFVDYDYIFAMDRDNLANLQYRCPPQYRHKLMLLLDHDGATRREVPDPYSGGPAGFELVLDLVENACEHWLQRLAHEHNIVD